MNYAGGIMQNCDSSRPDHGASVVGWGHDDASGLDYYILRNMWGLRWGEDGYARVAMDK